MAKTEYRMPTMGEAEFSELLALIQRLHELERFGGGGTYAQVQAQMARISAWLEQHGWREPTPTKPSAPPGISAADVVRELGEQYGPHTLKGRAVKAALVALEMLEADFDQAREVIQKSGDARSAVEKGEEYDEAASQVLMHAAETLAKSVGVGIADALALVGRASPELWEANARRSSGTSREYWRACSRR
jgi:hypothetical protein